MRRFVRYIKRPGLRDVRRALELLRALSPKTAPDREIKINENTSSARSLLPQGDECGGEQQHKK